MDPRRAIILDLSDDDLDALLWDDSAPAGDRLEAASEVGARKGRARDARHAAFHGHALRYGRVGRRPGYRGDTVCLDCYHGRAWPG